MQLSYRERDRLFRKEYADLRIKVALNFLELLIFACLIFILVYSILENVIDWSNIATPVIISLITSLVSTGIFYKTRKYQLTISRFDKEKIYKKVSNELLEEKKRTN